MNFKKFSLKNADKTTADKILENTPADWDMDKVFNKSYSKFLAAENKVNRECSESTENAESYPVEVISPERNRFITVFNRAAAVLSCMAVVLLMFRALSSIPDNIIESPDNPDIPPIIADDDKSSPTEKEIVPTETAYAVTKTTSSAVTEIITVKTTVVEKVTDADTTTYPETDIPDEPETPDIPDEPTYTEETAPTTTIITIISTTPQTIAVTTTGTTATTTTESAENAWGYFSFKNQLNFNNNCLVYVRSRDDEVHEKEYSVELDGFTVSQTFKDDFGEGYSLKDDSSEQGYGFQLLIFPYEYFKIDHVMYPDDFTFFEINDKPACSKIIDGYALLLWDNGYNICRCDGSAEHYDEMLLLAECLE